jgi:predicted dehydrogenase
MTRLRWGILGTGWIARHFANDLNIAGLAVSAVGSRRREVAEAFAREFGISNAHGSYDDLVSDPDVDIIYVASPNPLHAEHAFLALEHGKHVVVEKPFALNEGEAAAIRDRAAELGLFTMEAMWTRYLPHMLRLHEILESGVLGDVRGVMADHAMLLPSDPSHRLNDLALGGGALLDLGIYPISFAWDVLGAPASIAAVGRLAETGADTEVSISMVHAGGGVSTSFTSSRMNGQNTAHVIGTEARIDIGSVWYRPSPFDVWSHDDTLIEHYDAEVPGRGMQFQAIAAEQLIASGDYTNQFQPIDETVAIIGTLDTIRRQIGVVYPGEGSADATREPALQAKA